MRKTLKVFILVCFFSSVLSVEFAFSGNTVNISGWDIEKQENGFCVVYPQEPSSPLEMNTCV